jgi:hypothetical protein
MKHKDINKEMVKRKRNERLVRGRDRDTKVIKSEEKENRN